MKILIVSACLLVLLVAAGCNSVDAATANQATAPTVNSLQDDMVKVIIDLRKQVNDLQLKVEKLESKVGLSSLSSWNSLESRVSYLENSVGSRSSLSGNTLESKLNKLESRIYSLERASSKLGY